MSRNGLIMNSRNNKIIILFGFNNSYLLFLYRRFIVDSKIMREYVFIVYTYSMILIIVVGSRNSSNTVLLSYV